MNTGDFIGPFNTVQMLLGLEVGGTFTLIEGRMFAPQDWAGKCCAAGARRYATTMPGVQSE